ncbi:hypothetical protein [Clostridium fallax]|uniref:Uncharacterized protein n=1 Tax=Clostridium fallax TaxID=1533 RepID=A0A1M4U318_9CLOT|nr:hypothetical protein [Clostridium fallax]SHE50917.1 hypothetical protein SAMN05443638_1042 [Clostridium fallax]SQB06045.1 Uncharacterised protein [Clostridium fallax]
MLKLVYKITNLTKIIKNNSKEDLLIEELEELNKDDFYNWIIDYFIFSGFKVNKKISNNLLEMTKEKFNYGVLILKEHIKDEDLYLLESLSYINNWDNLIILTLQKGNNNKILENINQKNINIINGEIFNIKYIDFIKEKRKIFI